MATITLTDRISVRVTAKDSTESSDQKKRDGGNTATALGGTGLTDSEKEELGDDLGETVTGEDGKTYARSDKVAGVLKKIAQEGKLSEPTEVHEGIGNYNVDSYGIGPTEFSYIAEDAPGMGWYGYYEIPESVYFSNRINNDGDTLSMTTFSKNSYTITKKTRNKSGSNTNWQYTSETSASKSVTIDGVTYSFFAMTTAYLISGSYTAPVHRGPNDGTISFEDMAGFLFGSTHTSGGAKIDPTGKTDAQIQKDIEDFAALNNCKMTSESGDSYIAVTDANGNPLYFLGT